MSSLIASIRNIGSSATEQKVENVTNPKITVEQDNIKYDITGPEAKKCRVVVSCESAQAIVKLIKANVDPASKKYREALDDKVKEIKKESLTLESAKLKPFFDIIKKIVNDISKARRIRDDVIKTDIKTKIPCEVFIKGEGKGAAPVRSEGHIVKVNIADKTVMITFKNKQKDETLYGVEINKLCINAKECKLTGGGAAVASNPDDKKNYIDICE
ncbi:MAG: hypothetical protein Hyperionvirus17_21 [Hyperionvirus sp.]|uniref:Uncharacterized protein n=1 Tax=Hyperionvirus sp. TaxID=2487770 RepID=A0A3G5ACX3_9VIRU|nr:MAG: hypothetical protein Hyperionvirus17_21 [Hyperionvirus sp.]